MHYWVLCSDELMEAADLWPAGLRPVGRSDELRPRAGFAWWLFEDDNAPAQLAGRRVELEIRAIFDSDAARHLPVLVSRSLAQHC